VGFPLRSPCTFADLVTTVTKPLDLTRLLADERASSETKVIQQEYFDLATDLFFHLCNTACQVVYLNKYMNILPACAQAAWKCSPAEYSSFNFWWFSALLESSVHFKSYFIGKIVEDLTRVGEEFGFVFYLFFI
jgi:hypothetical protein